VLVVWKGIQTKVELSGAQIAISVMAVAGGATTLQVIFVLPYLWRRIMKRDWQLKWYFMWQGPFLLRRPPPPPQPLGDLNITDYYHGHLTLEELNCIRASEDLLRSIQSPQGPDLKRSDTTRQPSQQVDGTPPRPPGPWNSYRVLFWRLKRIIFRGLEKDVIKMQKRSAILKWNIEEMHARAPRYDNRAEYMYSSLQILTASSASFIHGANDVSNAITPFASTYLLWRSGRVESEVAIPVWVLLVISARPG
jgi:sodium-dependent phosphate transporter